MPLPQYSYTGPIDHTVSPDLSKIRGKSVIITGGANGMGEECLRKFVTLGAFVTFGDVNDRGRDIETELNANGECCAFVKCDIRDWDQQVAMFERAKSRSPTKSVDVVIANAGISRSSGDSLWNLDDPDDDPVKPDLNIVDVNLKGTLYTWKLGVHYFRQQPETDGRDRCFIITGSMVAWIDSPGNWEYTTTKYGLRGFMRTVRRSSWEQGIRIAYVAPCWIKSAIRSAEYEKWLIDHGIDFGEPEDVANCMLRIASDKRTNGRSLMIVPRSIAKQGYMDIDREDYKDAPEDEYLRRTQETQLVIIEDKWRVNYKRQPRTLPYSPPSTPLQGRQLGKVAPFRPFRRLFGQPHPHQRQSLLRYLFPHAARQRYRERLLDFRLDTLPYYKHRLQSRIYRYILASQQRRLSKTRWVDHIGRAAQNSRRLLFGPQPGPARQGHQQHRKTQGWRGNAPGKTGIDPGDKTRGGNMAQSGGGASGYGSSYGYGYGGGDPGQYADREPGARRKKLAGFAKSVYQAGVATASEIRNQYDNTRIRGVVDVDDSSYKVSIPGSFPDVSIVSKGDEQMVLFPSYAARHVRQFRDDDRQPSAHVDGERREADLSEEDYWRNEWARMEDKKAVVDVDVRGWVYAPHKGPMTRKNRVLIGLARRLSGVPQQTHQPPGQSESLRTGYEAREDAREQQKIDKEAEMIERRGQAEKEAAVKGGYSETPKEDDSEGEGPGTSLRSRSASGTATPMSGASSPRLSARPANNTAAAVELTEAELAVANANLMARLGPFLTTPLVELPVTLFFYNDDQSVSRTVMTNDSGHFYIRAALDFVPTHVRVLANEKLSAVEPVDIISDDGVSLISDIDDTIKKSSISMGAREIFRNTFIRDLKDLTVAGVREWYGELHKMGVRFHYCSNSPWQLFPVIATFFGLAGLPPGSLHLKQYSGMLQGIFEPVAERKKGTLEKILRDFPRRRFILVGDSGEADLEVYTDLALANPGRILAIFIRDVTTPEQAGYFDSAFNAPAPAGPSSRQQPTNAHSRKDSGSDHPDRRPALPSRTATRPEEPVEEDLIDFSDEPQNMTAKEEHNLDKSMGVPSPSAVSQDHAPRKKPPPPRPSKPAALRGESSGSLKTEAPASSGGPATLGKKLSPSQPRSTAAHPLAQTQNSSAQSLGKSPTLPPRKPSYGSNSNSGSVKSNNNSSNAPSPPASYSASSSSKQPPPPPPPRRRGTPSLISSSPRQRALRRATSNSDIDSLNLDSSATMSTPRPGPPNRTGTASTFDSILGSTTGHTMQQGGQNLPVNKKLELWLRRLERAHETLEREGVRLYTWRKGGDVVSEAVGIVKEATESTKGANNARR